MKRGAIRINGSYVTVKHCKFNDNYSRSNGGVFHIKNSYYFLADSINVDNSTAYEKGSLIYMYSSNNYKTNASIINAVHIEGHSSLYMENFKGERLYADNGISAFTLNSTSKIELKNIEMNEIYGGNKGGVLFTSYNEEIGSQFKVTNGTFTKLYHLSNLDASLFLYVKNNIEISLNDCYIEELKGMDGYFIYNENYSKIELNNVELVDFQTKSFSTLFKSKKSEEDIKKNEN
eukprot:jgi/Orpsp1_1/1187212/evm.model.d7180000056127.1